ncbi:uncharacterized abhydrolase domain-containing protein DDB_G0269086-like [Manihot esculenta]|uniref:uncharacterized abhydrolase domain-containing protein DDB_G0269086-like n=1 Tax=Manihot esculenta TaxID=3983 RepID=UPI001CC36E13|nr:uncharacterized abhydrolase domain-containing protein DDB_G0269086-like [Manihot esculenta]
MVQAASSKKVSRPPAKASSRASKPGSRSTKSSRLPSQVSEVSAQDAPASVRTGSEGVLPKTRDKRPAPSETSASSPARKKSRAATGPSPALPPLGKKKGVPAVPSLSPSGNVLNASDITPESPASAVAELLRERMFDGITEASDPRLLALTGLLASSTKEQVSFRSRSHEELGSSIREMLLMESVDRRIEEARLEENLSATSDARSNLVAAREQIQSLQVKLHSALEALKKADEKAAETAGHTKSLEAELSQTREVLKVSDERAAALEVRCEGVLKQLSSMTEALSERDEAVRQKAEVQQQYGALKADFEELQAQLEEAKAQKEAALARVEEFVAEACEEHLDEYKASSEMKSAVLKKAFYCRRDICRPSESSSEESELEREDVEVPESGKDDPNSGKEDLHLESEIAPVVNVEGSDPRDSELPELPADETASRNSVGEGVLTDVSSFMSLWKEGARPFVLAFIPWAFEKASLSELGA